MLHLFLKGLVWYLRRSEGISFGASFYIIGYVSVFSDVRAYLAFERVLHEEDFLCQHVQDDAYGSIRWEVGA